MFERKNGLSFIRLNSEEKVSDLSRFTRVHCIHARASENSTQVEQQRKWVRNKYKEALAKQKITSFC